MSMITFASIFSDHAVLQRDRELIIWGSYSAVRPAAHLKTPGDSAIRTSAHLKRPDDASGRTPGDAAGNLSRDMSVTLSLFREDAKQQKDAVFVCSHKIRPGNPQKDNTWKASLGPQPAGGPYTLTVVLETPSGPVEGTASEICDIWFGDVYLLGGQSNMEYRLSSDIDFRSGNIRNFEYPQVRSFRVPRIDYIGAEPEKCAENNTWSLLSKETAGNFSAVSFFFASKMYEHTGVPIGLIDVNRGGTSASCWVDEYSLRSDADLSIYLDEYRQLIAKIDIERNKSEHDAYYTDLAEYSRKASECETKGLSHQETEKLAGPYPWPPPAGPYAYRSPCFLFHTMIEPCIPYGIRAVLFYQGEEDAARHALYKKLLGSLIACWRRYWGMPELPFLIVQIAPFDDPQDTQNSAAFIREAQSETAAAVCGVTVVVTTDCGEKDNIHPQSKIVIGERLYRKACRYLLNENIAADSPQLLSAARQGAGMRLEFDVKGAALQPGCDGKDETLEGFFLAGEDGIYYSANASVSGKIVVVQSENVAAPCFVRYAFGGYVRANLYNDCKIPAEPFRTDRFIC